MDHIIFYKQDRSFKEKVSKIRFSYTRASKVYFAYLYDQIGVVLKKQPEVLLFYFTEELEMLDRVRLKNIVINYPKVKVCLCSEKEFALDAWKLNLFHFEDFPIDTSRLTVAYKKYVQHKNGDDRELTLKEGGEIIKIPYDNITYLKASGNYTSINQKTNKSIFQTKQLGTFEFITEKDLNFQRVHRSIILNLKNIKTVGHNKVNFYNCEKPLNISDSLQSKIKKLLIGKI